MNKWMLLLSLFSAASYSTSEAPTEDVFAPDFNSSELNSPDFKPPEISLRGLDNIVCASECDLHRR